MQNLKVIGLEAENVKRLHAVSLKFDGTLQVIGGDNGEGKSSVLDAIWLAIGGKQATKDTQTSRPIHDGQDVATATVDLGEIIVTRTWKAGKASTVKVTTPEGAEHKSPQTILDALTAKVGIDPLAFTQLSPKDQVAELLNLVELPFVPAELDAQYADAFQERTTVNRQVGEIEARLKTFPQPEPDLPTDEVSVSALVAEFQRVDGLLKAAKVARDLHQNAVEAERELEARLASARMLTSDRAKALARAETDAAGAPDLEHVRAVMDGAEETNRAIRVEQERQRGLTALKSTKAKADALTARLDKIKTTRTEGLAKATWPIEDLGFDADGLTYKGVPFNQASSAEQIRVSMAMAMALNPSLRTLFIRDGSLLDGKHMRLVAEMAAEHGYQVIMERVGTADAGAIIIEDGQVAG